MTTKKSVAIVTGASQGIGRATALRLARDFSVVALIARDKDKLEQTSSEVRSVGAEAMIFNLDLREPQSAETVVKGTLERFGRIDALLNIAGAVPQIDLFEMKDAQWDDGMAPMYDSLLTTWHEKFRYLRVRPALLETGLPTVILTPKHPSYPAGHGTYVAAGVTVLESFFPDEHSEYEYLIPEVNNARVWAGVHFRDEMLAGNVIGQQVADAVMEKVHLAGSVGERSKRVLGQPLVTSAFFGDGGPNYH